MEKEPSSILTFVTNMKTKKVIRFLQWSEDGSKAMSRNVVCIEYISDNEQRLRILV
jgi:hypothetical protein